MTGQLSFRSTREFNHTATSNKTKPVKQSMKFSEDQQHIFKHTVDFMLTADPYISIIGPAGSGKTFLMKSIGNEARRRKWKVRYVAPTHKAVANLSEHTGKNAQTIYKFLGLAMKEDNKTGELNVKREGPTYLEKKVFLIVDEAGFIPKAIMEYLYSDVDKAGDVKVLFVGDIAQANPVGEDPCIAVDLQNCPWPILQLTNIHRQALDSPIIRLATKIRDADPENLPQPEDDNDGEQGVFVLTKHQFVEQMISACAKSEESNDRYIGYTNQAIDNAAKAIRKARYGDKSLNPYIVGERLIVNDRFEYQGKTRKQHVENNTEVVVEHVYKDGDFYYVTADVKGKPVLLKATESYAARNKILDQLRLLAIYKSNKREKTKAWKAYFAAANTIADLRSSTSISIHKSQGSTFRDVYMNLDTLRFCRTAKEKQRLYYTAVTRASRGDYFTGSI